MSVHWLVSAVRSWCRPLRPSLTPSYLRIKWWRLSWTQMCKPRRFSFWNFTAESCMFLHPAAFQLSNMRRWKILYVSHHFQLHSFHIHSGETEQTHKNIWNGAPPPQYWWKQETEPQMTSQISFSLGVLRGRPATPPQAHRPINTRNQAITPLFWKACTIDMLLFFICWLYLIPSLLFPLPEQRGSDCRPHTRISYFFREVL